MKVLVFTTATIVAVVLAQPTSTPSSQEQECPTNEEFMQCGIACEPSCTTKNPKFCTMQCIVNVCQCSKGYVRAPNGRCIPPQQCPQNGTHTTTTATLRDCGAHAHLGEGQDEKCAISCEDVRSGNEAKPCNFAYWYNQCYCDDGYVRTNNGGKGDCVPRAQCTQS